MRLRIIRALVVLVTFVCLLAAAEFAAAGYHWQCEGVSIDYKAGGRTGPGRTEFCGATLGFSFGFGLGIGVFALAAGSATFASLTRRILRSGESPATRA
jgi:hypothetical protein